MLHSCWQLASAHIYHKNIKKSMQHTTPKPAFCNFDTGGNAVHFFQNRVFGGMDFLRARAGGEVPPPSPPPVLAKLRTAQGLVRNLARKGGGEGGRSFRVGTELCWRPFVIIPFFFFSCFFTLCNFFLHDAFTLFMCTLHPITACI